MTPTKRKWMGTFLVIIASAFCLTAMLAGQTITAAGGLLLIGITTILATVGWILIISAYWPGISPIDVPEELKDDMASIRNFSPTMVWLLAPAALGGSVIFIQQFLHYRKIEAFWGAIPVVLIAAVTVVCLAAGLLMTDWFRERYRRTGPKWSLTIIAGFALSLFLGVYFTEPLEYGAQSRNDKVAATMQQSSDEHPAANDYSRSRTGVFYYSNWASTGGSSASSSSGSSIGSGFKCSGKSCEGIAYVLLIILVLILIIASAVIPHFWVVACATLLTMIWILFIRELLYYEQRKEYGRYY